MIARYAFGIPDHNPIAVWTLVLIVPVLLAAELSERSGGVTHLPEPESYRSNFADQVLKNSTWRQRASTVPDWRAPASPKIDWRTGPPTQSSQAIERPNIELYPQYHPGGSSTFDLSTREDQSGIKIFEFDFGR